MEMLIALKNSTIQIDLTCKINVLLIFNSREHWLYTDHLVNVTGILFPVVTFMSLCE